MKKIEPFFFFLLFEWNLNDLDTYRKWLFSLIIIVKVPLVIAKSHYFLKKILKNTK